MWPVVQLLFIICGLCFILFQEDGVHGLDYGLIYDQSNGYYWKYPSSDRYENNINLNIEIPLYWENETLANFTVNITTFELEESESCKADAFMVYNQLQSVRILEPICGTLTEPLIISYVDYAIVLKFVSDDSWVFGGFEMTISRDILDNEQICSMMHDPIKQIISSAVNANDRRYADSIHCQWNFTREENKSLTFNIHMFDIEFSKHDCWLDKLEIYELQPNHTNFFLTARLCGRHLPQNYTTDNDVMLKFHTDSYSNRVGFRITYTYNIEDDFLHNKRLSRMYWRKEWQALPWSTSVSLSSDIEEPLWRLRTNPGYIISLSIKNIDQTLLSFFDGPDETYPELQKIIDWGSESWATSTGFYLTITPCNTCFSSDFHINISFNANLDFSLAKSSVIREGEKGFYLPKESGNDNIMYFSIGSTEGNYPRLSLKDSIDIFDTSPNVNNCEKTGIVLYPELNYHRAVGPFCGFSEGFVHDILPTLIGSNSTLHAVIYDYAYSFTRPKSDGLLFEVLPSKCRGFQLTDRMFQMGYSVSSQDFSLAITEDNNNRTIQISYDTSYNECYLILVLSNKVDDLRYTVSTNKTFDFYVCENLCSVHSSDHSWLKQFGDEEVYSRSIIQIGPFDTNTCEEFTTCWIREVSLNCGIIHLRESLCTWKLMLPQTEKGYFKILFHRIKPRDNMEADVEIIERTSNWNHRAVLSYQQLGKGRPYPYLARDNAEIYIKPSYNTEELFLSFERLPGKQRPVFQSGCHEDSTSVRFQDSCYILRTHTYSTSWLSAQQDCLHKGTKLVSINTREELEFLKSAMTYMSQWGEVMYALNKFIFIGLQDIKAGQYVWEDGSNLGYSDWHKPFVFDRLPMSRKKMEPSGNTTKRCAGMIPTKPAYSSNWRKVPCSEAYWYAYSICEKSIQLESNVSDDDYFSLFYPKVLELSCPDGWNMVKGHCLAVLTHNTNPRGNTTLHDVTKLCENYGGQVCQVDYIGQMALKLYLQSQKLGSSANGFWYRTKSGRSGCLFVSMIQTREDFERQMQLVENSCDPTHGPPSNVLCESPVVFQQRSCQRYQFACNDGSCLTPDLVCDGMSDCREGEDEFNCMFSNNFTCSDGKKISLFKLCDFRNDCPLKTDEKNCVAHECHPSEWRCDNKQCIALNERCDHKTDCEDASDEKSCDWDIECKAFKCKLVGCVPDSKVLDSQPDCPDETEGDEEVFPEQQRMFPWFKEIDGAFVEVDFVLHECSGFTNHQRCHKDHSRCYPRHKNCIFDHDIYGSLKYCRDGSHLTDCESFECPGMFKCRQSYCIPLHKVCDGRKDCTKGEDESSCEDVSCPHELRCGKTKQCVSQEFVCDGQVHCSEDKSDELYCDLIPWSCPENCTCLGYHMSCGDHEMATLPHIPFSSNLRLLNFSFNLLELSNETLIGYHSLAYLYINQNLIRFVYPNTFSHSPNLLHLDLSDNMIEYIPPYTFNGLENLQTLYLLGNPVRSVFDASFLGMSVLRVLNLSSMSIAALTDKTFDGLYGVEVIDLSQNTIQSFASITFAAETLPSLKTLLIDENPLESTGPETFASITVTQLHTSSFRFCCFSNQVPECEPKQDTYSSCSALLQNDFLRSIVWCLGLMAIIANSTVVGWILFEKVSNVPSIFVLNLALSDLMMGLFLVSIAIADLHYRGNYILKDLEWRNSVYCKLIGVVITISVEMSMFTLLIIATDRTKRLAYPFTTNQISKKYAWVIEVIGWIVCVFLASLPLLMPSYFGNFYGRNSICVPFNLSGYRTKGWEFSTAVFVVLNSLALILMVIMYTIIYFRVKESSMAAGRKDRSDLDLARNLSMIISSNIFCFVPIVVANISSVVGFPVSREMASLLTAVLLPLNSLLNPCIFLLGTIRSKRLAKKRSSKAKRVKGNPASVKHHKCNTSDKTNDQVQTVSSKV